MPPGRTRKLRRRRSVFPLNFDTGRLLSGKYEVVEKLGEGWEGEVYKITEVPTGIERVAKFYFPERDPGGKASARYARKVSALADCRVITQYHHRDWIKIRRRGLDFRVEYLVSQFAEGEMLSRFQKRQPGRRLQAFQALHLFAALVRGIQEVHHEGWYHGDIHSENILVKRRGIGFKLKLLDFFDLGSPTRTKQLDDIVDMSNLLYEMVGGAAHYAKQPAIVKHFCAGRRRDLILRRFPDVYAVMDDLEGWDWEEQG